MSVDERHPEYKKHLDRWTLVRSVIDSDAKKYIKEIDSNDPNRNTQYRDDAILTNFTSRTKNALVGSVFRTPPIVVLPTALEYLVVDATGGNLSLNQLTQEVVGDVIEIGRFGLLVDYPAAEDGLTGDEVAQLNLAARIYPYKAESIINWQNTQMNGVTFLSMVVLKETVDVLSEDGFAWETKDQYRVLRMVDGVYEQHLYNDTLELVAVFQPKRGGTDRSQGAGAVFNYIPFTFIGSENNDSKVDNAPLYDLAGLNIGHLKNSADYEESVHITGQPTLFISSGYSAEEFKSANPNGIKIGARAGHNLGESSSATMLQAQPNQLADVAMQRKEQQAVMTGARLIMPQSGVETAEAARIRYSSENSVLSTVVNNVSDGIESALEDAAEFMGVSDEEIVYKLNTQFYDRSMDPQLLMAQIQLLDRGIIAESDLRSNVRQAGMIEADRTDDDIKEEAGEVDPLL